MSIKFSILIPVYNVEKYLQQCIDSVLNQTYKEFEIILVDDGSTDRSGFICDQYEKFDNRVVVFHQDNQGIITTRRTSIKNAKGDFCLFLDSDDYWDKDLLETVNNIIMEYNCDLVIYNYKKITQKGVIINDTVLKDRSTYNFSNKLTLFELIVETPNINPLWIKAVKHTIIDDTDYSKYKKLMQSEDLLQSLPLLYNAELIVCIDKPMYNYRQNLNSITYIINEHIFEDISISTSILLDYLKKLNIDNKYNNKIFYVSYAKSISRYIYRFVNMKILKIRKIQILKDVKKIQLYIDTKNNIKGSDLRLFQRLEFFLLNRDFYSILFCYENLLKLARWIKMSIVGKRKSQ